MTSDVKTLATLEEMNPDDVTAKEQLYEQLRHKPTWEKMKNACDLWTASFFLPLVSGNAFNLEGVPTTQTIRQCLATNTVNGQLSAQAMVLSHAYPFFHWQLEFPDVFHQGGFDVVLGNPPWDRIKLTEKEFFAMRDREIAEAPNKAAREKLILELPRRNPVLNQEFELAKHHSEAESKFIRFSLRCPLTARGDINTYSIFAETSRCLLNPRGRAGIIVPSGIATDDTTSDFFADLVGKQALVSLYDFENREGIFPGIHRSYKFCLLTFGGNKEAARNSQFAFFLRSADGLREPDKIFSLSSDDFRLLNPNTLTCPIFRTMRDAEITKGIYRRVPVMVNEKTSDNPWAVSFVTMFHMTNDSHLFNTAPSPSLLPLYEAKMIEDYDHRFAGVIHHSDRVRTGEPEETTLEQHMNPHFYPKFRYWVNRNDVAKTLGDPKVKSFLVYKDITTASSEKTFKATILPFSAVGNSAPIILIRDDLEDWERLCLLGNFNTFALDYVARQKIGYLHINFFLLKQFPVFAAKTYHDSYPWLAEKFIGQWIASRVFELTYTAWDLQLFAQDLGYNGPPFRWDVERRFIIRCELDACFFHLYGISCTDVDYIMDTFPIVKRKDEDKYSEYRTKRVILEIYDEIERAIRTGQLYQTRLNPPPRDPRAAHQS